MAGFEVLLQPVIPEEIPTRGTKISPEGRVLIPTIVGIVSVVSVRAHVGAIGTAAHAQVDLDVFRWSVSQLRISDKNLIRVLTKGLGQSLVATELRGSRHIKTGSQLVIEMPLHRIGIHRHG